MNIVAMTTEYKPTNPIGAFDSTEAVGNLHNITYHKHKRRSNHE
ncbi:MAG: hypothetical protein ACRC2R_20080 [Xenococcaceae cyanobacterium]